MARNLEELTQWEKSDLSFPFPLKATFGNQIDTPVAKSEGFLVHRVSLT